MSIHSSINNMVSRLFKVRTFVLALFTIFTVIFAYQATQIKLDASFTKNIPLQHSYMKTYLKHQENFGGANNVLISVCESEGSMFNSTFFTTLKGVHDQLFFIPGVDRTQVKSLFSPSTRFVEIVEDGFAGGSVIPADFIADDIGLEKVKQNIEKAGIVGSIVSDDYSCAMVKTSLMDVNPETGEKLDTLNIAKHLEEQIRGNFETGSITIHIIGFTKMVGDVAEGAKSVVTFFAIAIVITAIMVYLFCKSIKLTILPITCSFIAVIWQMGILTTLGFGLDPMSILIPFLIFAIGVSHGVQMINAINKLITRGKTNVEAAKISVCALLIPGVVALLSDTVGFLTLLSIDIGIIRELAIAASLGVAMIILTNLILLPLLVSLINISPKVVFTERRVKDKGRSLGFVERRKKSIWTFIANLATKGPATIVLIFTALLFILGAIYSQDMKIGELHKGAPALHENSRYNQDTSIITNRFAISVDYLSIIVESVPDACTRYKIMNVVDQFQWRMENIEGVQSVISLASVAKVVNAGYNEGNAKWRVLSKNQQTLVQSIARIPSSSGLLNNDCSVMPIIVFLNNHKADTISRVIDAVKLASNELNNQSVSFKLASGPIGVMAATNETVKEAQLPMMLYIYSAVILLCLLSFRSIKATIVVVVPLYIVSTLAQWLMTSLDIGLTVSTLPVIALGVGIGVDYGIYILSTMNHELKKGHSVKEAYQAALTERGSAVIITGITLAIGVSTWMFSDLKFQVDMGIVLTFMFLVNMLAAVVILPAIATFLWKDKK